jgi:peptidoglycan hydrolase CwlO-like protein
MTAALLTAAAAMLAPAVGAAPGPDSGSATTRSGASTTTVPAATPSASAATSRTGARANAEASAASLRRDRQAIRAEVAALQQQRDDQFNRWALTQLALESARNEALGAVMLAEKARRDALGAKEQLTEYATEAFMSPPATESLAVLAIGDAVAASRAHDLLSIVADEQREVVGDFLEAHSSELRRSRDAEQRAAEHGAAEEANEVELRRLDELLARQEALDAEIDARLDAALAEVAALEEVDRQAARELEAQERALAEQSKAAVAASPAARSNARAPGASAATPLATGGPTTTGGGGASAPPTTVKAPAPAPAPTTTTPPKSSGPPPAPPSGLATWQDVTKVGGIWVHRSIASRVQGLLDAAAASGIRLGGGGFRDPSEQIRLRQAHCGPSEYDVYYKPASQCTPPTAQPGKSMHERGLAIDFTVNGRVISSRSDAAFQWLAANAASFGFYNLPSEPWHWSTNGS